MSVLITALLGRDNLLISYMGNARGLQQLMLQMNFCSMNSCWIIDAGWKFDVKNGWNLMKYGRSSWFCGHTESDSLPPHLMLSINFDTLMFKHLLPVLISRAYKTYYGPVRTADWSTTTLVGDFKQLLYKGALEIVEVTPEMVNFSLIFVAEIERPISKHQTKYQRHYANEKPKIIDEGLRIQWWFDGRYQLLFIWRMQNRQTSAMKDGDNDIAQRHHLAYQGGCFSKDEGPANSNHITSSPERSSKRPVQCEYFCAVCLVDLRKLEIQ